MTAGQPSSSSAPLPQPTQPISPTPSKDWLEIRKKISIKLLRWFFFSLLIGIIPLQLNRWQLAIVGKPSDYSLVISHGELSLISAAIAASALGDMIACGKDLLLLKLFVGALATILLLLCCGFFALASSSISSPNYNIGMVVTTSTILFWSTTIIGAVCTSVSEM